VRLAARDVRTGRDRVPPFPFAVESEASVPTKSKNENAVMTAPVADATFGERVEH